MEYEDLNLYSFQIWNLSLWCLEGTRATRARKDVRKGRHQHSGKPVAFKINIGKQYQASKVLRAMLYTLKRLEGNEILYVNLGIEVRESAKVILLDPMLGNPCCMHYGLFLIA
eukprot:jgi/Botrbrau1/14642/Bobra.0108s0005.1